MEVDFKYDLNLGVVENVDGNRPDADRGRRFVILMDTEIVSHE
jgi:hypothetical protein